MTNKHTPGPWVISGSSIWNTETHRAIYASGCKPISERDEEGQANARLIASAPELLEALEWCLQVYGGEWPENASIRDTIKKAKGE